MSIETDPVLGVPYGNDLQFPGVFGKRYLYVFPEGHFRISSYSSLAASNQATNCLSHELSLPPIVTRKGWNGFLFLLEVSKLFPRKLLKHAQVRLLARLTCPGPVSILVPPYCTFISRKPAANKGRMSIEQQNDCLRISMQCITKKSDEKI